MVKYSQQLCANNRSTAAMIHGNPFGFRNAVELETMAKDDYHSKDKLPRNPGGGFGCSWSFLIIVACTCFGGWLGDVIGGTVGAFIGVVIGLFTSTVIIPVTVRTIRKKMSQNGNGKGGRNIKDTKESDDSNGPFIK